MSVGVQERERASVCEREKERERASVCGKEKEREREKQQLLQPEF